MTLFHTKVIVNGKHVGGEITNSTLRISTLKNKSNANPPIPFPFGMTFSEGELQSLINELIEIQKRIREASQYE